MDFGPTCLSMMAGMVANKTALKQSYSFSFFYITKFNYMLNKKILFLSFLMMHLYGIRLPAQDIVFNFKYNQAIGKSILFFQNSIFFEPYAQLERTVSTTNIDSNKHTYSISIVGLNQPTLLSYRFINSATNWNHIYAIPGDTLSVSLIYDKQRPERYMLHFEGKNAQNYNLAPTLDSFTVNLGVDSTYFGYYDKMLKHQNEISKRLDSISFNNLDLKNNLPIISKASLIDRFTYKINSKILSSTELEHFISHIIPVFDVKSKYLLRINQFVSSAKSTLQVLEFNLNKNKDFYKKCEIIEKYYESDLKELLLANAFYKYTKSASLSTEELKKANLWYQKFEKSYPKSPYLPFAKLGTLFLSKIKRPFPEELLTVELVDEEENKISFSKLLQKYSESPLIIDHWATWCGPCIEEFNVGAKTIAQLKAKGLKFVYISIDKDQDYLKSRKLSEQYKLKSYRLLDKSKAVYVKYFDLKYIPRLVLFNEKGQIVNFDMPHVSSSNEFRQRLGEGL